MRGADPEKFIKGARKTSRSQLAAATQASKDANAVLLLDKLAGSRAT